MAVIWEWVGEGSLERQIEVVKLLSPNNTAHAGGIAYEEGEPDETEVFSAKGLTWAQVTAIRVAARVRLSTYTLTDKLGRTFEGYITRIGWRYINGTPALFEVTLNLLLPPTDPD